MTIPHPIPYQGSKRNLASEILQYIPQDIAYLIEPFAGSAALSLAAAYHHKAHHFILNDMNSPLMSLWSQIIYHPEQLAERYHQLWTAQLGRERQFYDHIRHRFNVMQPSLFFILISTLC